MNFLYQEIVQLLKEKHKTVSTMESCTGGALASEITNIAGSSEIFYFGAVTYSNEFKIKMGVERSIIDEYSVYSIQTAKEMSYHISEFTHSDYGIGITGKLNRTDQANLYGRDDMVYISIYNKEKNEYYTASVEVQHIDRVINKKKVLEHVATLFLLHLHS